MSGLTIIAPLDRQSVIDGRGSKYVISEPRAGLMTPVPGPPGEVTLAELADPAGSGLIGFRNFGPGAVLRDLEERGRDTISLRDYGVKGDGVTDDSDDIEAAFAAAKANGIAEVLADEGEFIVSRQIENPGVVLRGRGDLSVFRRVGGLPSPLDTGNLFISGQLPDMSKGVALAANAAAGDFTRQITLVSGGGAQFTAGTYAIIYANFTSIVGSASRDAEYVFIESISGNTLTLKTPLLFSYATANTAKLMPVELTAGVGYRNIHIVMDDSYVIPDPSTVDYIFTASGIYNRFCINPIMDNVSGERAVFPLICLFGCIGASVTNARPHDLYSDTYDKPWATGYGVAERALNVGAIVDGMVAERCRTAYTTIPSPFAEWPYGQPTGTLVSNGIHIGSKSTGWDTHGNGLDITFSNLKAIGARRAAFQVRSRRMTVRNVEALDCGGGAVAIFGGGSSHSCANDVLVSGVRSRNTNTYNGVPVDPNDRDWRTTGAIHVGCERAVVEDVDVDTCGGPLINEATLALYPEYRRIRARRVHNLALGVSAIGTGNAAACEPEFDDVLITDSPNVTSLIYRGNFGALPKMHRVRSRGMNAMAFTSVTGEANAMISSGYGPQAFSAVQQSAALAGDALNVVSSITSCINILPETGTSDTFSKITGGVTGGYIEVWGSAGNIITVAHGTGTDNLFLKGSTNVVLPVNGAMAFRRKGSIWFEMWRSF